MNIVVQRTYEEIKQNKNQWKILSSFRETGFLLENWNQEIYKTN